jgi:hypothetical protein
MLPHPNSRSCIRLFLLSGCLLSSAVSAPASAGTAPSAALAGTWQLDTARSDEVPAWRNLELVIAIEGDAVTITRNLGWGRRRYADAVTATPGAGPAVQPIAWWADNRHLGVVAAGDGMRRVVMRWADGGRTLRAESTFVVETQQSTSPMRITTEFRLWPDGDRLTMVELRSTRQAPITYHFTRKP